LILVAVWLAACGDNPATPVPSTALAVANATAVPSPSPSPSATPQASPSPTARATVAPTATPKPTPVPTPVPWKSYTSKRYHYKIQYPPTWIVTPGTGGYSDQFDDFSYPIV
jgi:hypothetical protein